MKIKMPLWFHPYILKQDFKGTFLFCVSNEEGSSKARKVYVESGITVQDTDHDQMRDLPRMTW